MRILRTCRVMGIETVAVYSDADSDAPHIGEADYAVRLNGGPPGMAYLRGDLIITAAQRTGGPKRPPLDKRTQLGSPGSACG